MLKNFRITNTRKTNMYYKYIKTTDWWYFAEEFEVFVDRERTWDDRAKALHRIKELANTANRHAVLFLGVVIQDENVWNVESAYDRYRFFVSKCPDASDYLYFRIVEGWSYVELFTFLWESAKTGNTIAMPALGWCCYAGIGTDESMLDAMFWFFRAANRNSLAAIKLFPMIEHDDIDTYGDYRKDIANLYKKGVELGDPECMTELAHIYKDGYGVEKSWGKAVELLEKAVELGETDAMVLLGNFYLWGEGVDKSEEKYKEYYAMAAENGHGIAALRLGWEYVDSGEYEKAVKYYELSANEGNPTAMFELGEMYEKGMGVEQSFDEAENLYRLPLAREGNIKMSADRLALLMLTRTDGKRSIEEGLKWMKIAADAGNEEAQAWIDEHCIMTLKH